MNLILFSIECVAILNQLNYFFHTKKKELNIERLNTNMKFHLSNKMN